LNKVDYNGAFLEDQAYEKGTVYLFNEGARWRAGIKFR